VGAISFLMVFLNLLIGDLDNPFGYYGGELGRGRFAQALGRLD
jgi:hypothetical protein